LALNGTIFRDQKHESHVPRKCRISSFNSDEEPFLGCAFWTSDVIGVAWGVDVDVFGHRDFFSGKRGLTSD
jgi:hypothetical protein